MESHAYPRHQLTRSVSDPQCTRPTRYFAPFLASPAARATDFIYWEDEDFVLGMQLLVIDCMSWLWALMTDWPNSM